MPKLNRIGGAFKDKVRVLALTCPICAGGAETYTTHGCPACGGTKRILPSPRSELEEMATILRTELLK